MMRIAVPRSCLAVCLCIHPALVLAYEVAAISIGDLMSRSTAVVHGRITAAQEVLIQRESGPINCGFDYEADVIERFKGEVGARIAFRSADSLTMGSEYLLFASEQDLGAMRRFLAMGRHDQDAFEICTRRSPGLFVSAWHGEALEFDYIGESLDEQRWLKTQAKLEVGPEVKQRPVTFQSDSVPEEYADHYSFTALRWTDVRKMLVGDPSIVPDDRQADSSRSSLEP